MAIDIDQCHRIGKCKDNRSRTIIFKLNKFKGKQNILSNAKKLKNTGIYIYEDFGHDTIVLRKSLPDKVLEFLFLFFIRSIACFKMTANNDKGSNFEMQSFESLKYSITETSDPVGIYLLKVNNRNTRTRFEICSKLTIKTPEQRHWRHFGIFIVNFEDISHLVLVFLLLTLNM